MSKLKLSPNLFLEVAELENFRHLMVDEGYKAALQSLVKNFGIARNSDSNAFEVTATGEENTISIAPGTAWNKDFDRIISREAVTAQAIQSDTKTWVILSRAVTNYEAGTVSVTTDGTLTGVGTEFTKVLRGGDNFPNAVKFIDSTKNILNYEVINVVSDTSAVIAVPAVAESNMRYGVIGAFTPGFVPSNANELIYEYDSFQIRMVQSDNAPDIQEGYVHVQHRPHGRNYRRFDQHRQRPQYRPLRRYAAHCGRKRLHRHGLRDTGVGFAVPHLGG